MVFRVRAAAIILNNENKLLLVHHKHPNTGEEWWTLPGGGLEGKEDAVSAVIREVKEECRIDCVPGKLVYVREFLDINDDIHHVELFFTADAGDYHVKTGKDPELDEQLITKVLFVSQKEIGDITVPVYPEILRDRFWEDLKNNFTGHSAYLGQREWLSIQGNISEG